MQTKSLIPSFEDNIFHAVDKTAALSFSLFSKELETIKTLANPLKCNEKFLPSLAYAFKVDFWDENLSTKAKRDLIMASFKLHRKKGTRWAILEVLKAVGLSIPNYEAQIIEYKDRNKYKYNVKRDGTYKYDNKARHNDGASLYNFNFKNWTDFALIIKTSISQSQASLARKLINIYKPVRSTLIGISCKTKQRDGSFFYDEKYTHGLM